MTIWSPALPTDTDPKYQALLDALLRDIQSGALPPGTRLPTQRQLAERLGVAIGTVGRAYAAADTISFQGKQLRRDIGGAD